MGEAVAASPSEGIVTVAHSAAGQGFVELDDYAANGSRGIAIVRAPSRDVAAAIGAHVLRRARAAGRIGIEGGSLDGAPLWGDVASRLGIGALPTDPAAAAVAIARAAAPRHAMVIAPLPDEETWDRFVARELALVDAPPTVVFFVTETAAPVDDLGAEPFEVRAALDAQSRVRWWAALTTWASVDVPLDTLASLDAWWAHARAPGAARSVDEEPITPAAEQLSLALALAARSWPVAEVAAFGGDAAALRSLCRSGAATVSDGWITICGHRRRSAVEQAPRDVVDRVVVALTRRHSDEAWAQIRVAELLAQVGEWNAADDAVARALAIAQHHTARREVVSRWKNALANVPPAHRLPLIERAAERALDLGEAAEAVIWTQAASALAPRAPRIAWLSGRAALAQGDLVAAKLALERAAADAPDDCARAHVAAELAEAAYLSGDLAASAEYAEAALRLDETPALRLRARNTLGKLLLARSAWDDAERHFENDAWTASAAGLTTEALRARLNRGIAVMSKGLLAEASAVFHAALAEAEAAGDARACAFALDNLSVAATLRHDLVQALSFSERSLKLRQQLGDRVTAARTLGNLAELRRSLGQLEHAEHAVAFGRRMVGPGMPPGRSAFLSIQAARNALARGDTLGAAREASRALAEAEAAGVRSYVSEACCVAARVAQEEGDLRGAAKFLEQTRAASGGDGLRAELLLLTARQARASGDAADDMAAEALAAARVAGKEELIFEADVLVAELHRAAGRLDAARVHVSHAIAWRDRVSAGLPADAQTAFQSRPEVRSVTILARTLADCAASDEIPSSARRPIGTGESVRSQPRGESARQLIGDDPAIRALLGAIKKVARSNSTVLVRGESGTGKELVAEAIHRSSDRASGPLVTVNCAALVDTLLLSELFGHEKGAFTGAAARRRGRFELAEGGTLFLDEIGDISIRAQIALLRVLQERSFERVGGVAVVRANVRVVCATHRDLHAMIRRGEFREDLFYRLSAITIDVPPLRERIGDLGQIGAYLLKRIAAERKEAAKALSTEALDVLERHAWPGNVRELENALRAASLFAEGAVITAETLLASANHLRGSTAPSRPGSASAHADTETAGASNASQSPSAIAYDRVRGGALSLPAIKRQVERDCIARALAETRGNITQAATILGMKRPRLSQLVRQYGFAVTSEKD